MKKEKIQEKLNVGARLKGIPLRRDTTVSLKSQKGITLIALVITIVVLLILAGVTLSIVFNGGIIDKSQNAVDKYSHAQQNETEILDYIDKQFGLQMPGLDNINGNDNKKVIESATTGQYYNPVIPVGFKTVNTETASWEVVEDATLGKVIKGWDNGLVIEDKDGNQFVWVPVDGTKVDYNRKLFNKNNSSITNAGISSLSDDKSAIPVSDETTQITKYGGFYIARYEAGNPSNGTVPLSKYNQTAWINVTYNNANTYAKSYKNNNSYVLSGLVTGRMWDSTMKWIAATDGLDILQNDSSSWGIYSGDGGPFNTGIGTSSKNTGKKNIYDLAGNLWEWTAEIYSSNRVYRGGGYLSDIYTYPATYRYDFLPTTSFTTGRFQSCTFCSVALIISTPVTFSNWGFLYLFLFILYLQKYSQH